eukprot:6260236-Ditylum_brightwellii.AAC.1
MYCVPEGRAIVLSRFYCETTSSHCTGEDAWRHSVLDSERLVAELEEMIGLQRNGYYIDLQNCILNMVPTTRQLLLVFQTTQETFSDYDVEQSDKICLE